LDEHTLQREKSWARLLDPRRELVCGAIDAIFAVALMEQERNQETR
jgi:hypothetical protein